MEIINSIAFGKSRKSAGNVVFYDRLGQTIARQKNLTPTNPNTAAQIGRRILITNPSRIYRAIVEGTRQEFGSKFFDYSFGRSYLATKRRTAYNEFFVRAMAMEGPAFMSKQDVLNRKIGYPVEAEIAQGSLPVPAFVMDMLGVKNQALFTVPAMTASSDASALAAALIAAFNYPSDGSFRAHILFHLVEMSQGTPSNYKVECASLLPLSKYSYEFKYTSPRLSIAGLEGQLKATFGGEDPAGQVWSLAGVSFVPFANVNSSLTSGNESIHLLAPEVSDYDVEIFTLDDQTRERAIQSYSPSTPTGYQAPTD